MENAIKKSNRGWIVLFGIIIMQVMFCGLASNTFSLYIEPVTTDIGILRGAFAITMTVNAIVNAAVSTTYGKLVAKLGIRNLILIGSIAGVLYALLFAFGKNLIVFYVASAGLGVCMAFCSVVSVTTVVNNWFKKRQGVIISVCMAMSGLGGMIFSPIVSGWIVNTGWQKSLLYTAICLAITTVVVASLVRNKPSDVGVRAIWDDNDNLSIDNSSAGGAETSVPGLLLKDARKTYNFYCVIIVGFLLGAVVYPVLTAIPAYAMDLGFTDNVGTIMSVLFLSNVILTIPLGTAFDKLGVRITMIISTLIYIAALAILSMSTISLSLMYVAAAIVGFGLALMQVPIPLMTSGVFGYRDIQSIVGLVFSGMTLGCAVASPIFNFGFDMLGSYRLIFMVYIGFALLMMVMSIIGTRKIDYSRFEGK